MERSVKQFSHDRKSTPAANQFAFLLALSLAFSPMAAVAQESGSLEDMWQEHQDGAKPEVESRTEKQSKKSKKSKKSKSTSASEVTGSDLTKSTSEPAARGWESGAEPGSKAGSLESASTTTSSTSAETPAQTTTPPATTTTSTETTTPPAATATPEPVRTPTTETATETPPATTTNAPVRTPTTETAVAKSDGPTQPLCKLTALTSSDLIKSGGWPGVGPFAQDQGDSDVLIDEAKNKLKLKLSGEDVTHAELLLVNQSSKPSQLLALQMTANFLLEAVGAQPGKIADFNNALQKNQEKLAGSEPGTQLDLQAGTYVVQIQRKGAQEATVPGNISYLIALDNQKPVIASTPPAPKDTTSFSVYTPPTSTTSTPATTPATTIAIKPATTSTPLSPKPEDDLLHRQFSNLITNWQAIKRATVKNRQAASLTRILGGRALTQQNAAIERLLNTKRFYELTPIELNVQTYREMTPGTKYEVDTFIKERRQLMNADTMKVEKDTTSGYNVIYTVEKIRGAWLITDTRMTAPATQ